MTLGFGAQTDTRIIRHGTDLPGTGQALNGQAVANYIAKYATKTLTAPGLPSHRLRSEADIERLRCSAHYRRLITTAWQLGSAARLTVPGLGAHARLRRPLPHQIPPLLRHLRPAPRCPHRPPPRRRPPDADRDAWGRPLDETVVLVLPVIWTYEGIGRPIAADAELALAAAPAPASTRPGPRCHLTAN